MRIRDTAGRQQQVITLKTPDNSMRIQNMAYDADITCGIVAAEPAGTYVRVFTRSNRGVRFHDHQFSPFLWVKQPDIAAKSGIRFNSTKLAGTGCYGWRLNVSGWQDLIELRNFIANSSESGSFYCINNIAEQFLVSSGLHFFSNLASDNLKILGISVATSFNCSGVSSRLHDGTEYITEINISDGSGYEELISDAAGYDEAAMIRRLSSAIMEHDPDLITGHRLFSRMLPLLYRKARHHRIRLDWGRNGSAVHFADVSGSTDRHYNNRRSWSVYGRTVVDTWLLCRQYDHYSSPLPGRELADIARHAGITASGSAALSVEVYRYLAEPLYQLARISHSGFQTLVNGSIISAAETVMLQRYSAAEQSLPEAVKTEALHDTPVLIPIQQRWHGTILCCDLSMLTPAVITAYRISPSWDKEEYFLKQVKLLSEISDQDKTGIHGITGKRLLLESWCRLVSATRQPFHDTTAAAELKRLEQVMMRDIKELPDRNLFTVLAIEQHRIYVAEKDTGWLAALTCTIEKQICRLAGVRIKIWTSGVYRAFVSYGQHVFALLGESGDILIRSSGTGGKPPEQFLADFMKKALGLLLEDRASELHQLYESYLRRLVTHDFDISWLMQTESLGEPPEEYRQATLAGKRKHAAVYELALSTPGQYQAGDRISYYVTGNTKNIAVHENCRPASRYNPLRPDVNIQWYSEKLRHLYERLKQFYPDEQLLF